MMDTVHTIYERQIKPLSVADRLQLMRLIMEDLAESAPRWAVEISDAWSHEDLHDLSRASLLYATQSLADEEKDVEPR
jgi:hypothetical protein